MAVRSIEDVLELTSVLQHQKDVPLWAIANQRLIYAIAAGEKVPYGPKRKYLNLFMKIAYKIKISDMLLFFVNLVVIMQLIYKANRKKTPAISNLHRIFACCGCLSDDYLFEKYKTRENNHPLRINWISGAGLSALKLPPLYVMVIQLVKLTIGYTKQLSKAEKSISVNIVEFLTTSATNIGEYIFYLEYWKNAKNMGTSEIAILVPSIQAFAAVDAKIKTIFMQHGLVELGVLMPKFDRIEALTSDEVSYFRNTLQGSSIYQCYDKKSEDLQCNNNTVMWLSVNFINESLGEHFDKWHEVDEWAKKNALQVVIRPTPKVTNEELEKIKNKFPNAIIDELSDTLDSSLKKWQPKFVIGWRSTGLATALEYGCLPVILHSVNAYLYTWNLIYPMQKRVLFWSRDALAINAALYSQESFYKNVRKLREQ